VKSDVQLQRAVLTELRRDPQLGQADVTSTVDHGVVELLGTVNQRRQRVAAQDAAHRVPGVLDVVNDIEVCPPSTVARSDRSVAQAVRCALQSDTMVPQGQIRSTVAHGWVTLEGTVSAWHQRYAAERAVNDVPGVRGIVSEIDVAGPSTLGRYPLSQ
jgi:osmotically-inducible protein OsmY